MSNSHVDGLVGGQGCHRISREGLWHDWIVVAAVGMHLPVKDININDSSTQNIETSLITVLSGL